MVQHFKVKNWEQLQHYKDRVPPWIKLYNDILENYEFSLLNDHEKFQLIAIYLLASRTKNKMPFDNRWIQIKIASQNEVDLGKFQQLGFIELIGDTATVQQAGQDASKALQSQEQSATVTVQQPYIEESREEESREDITSPDSDASPDKSGSVTPLCPHQKIVDLYHEILPELAPVRDITDQRQKTLRARWRQHKRFQNLDWWRDFFEAVKERDFLMGRTKDWQANFDFLITASKFQKIIEGGYQNGSAAS